MTIEDQREDENLDEKIINEGTPDADVAVRAEGLTRGRAEYKTWKKNAPFLYDLMLR